MAEVFVATEAAPVVVVFGVVKIITAALVEVMVLIVKVEE